MDKKFCDECGKEIHRHWVSIEYLQKEMDYGVTVKGRGGDFCSENCTIKFLKVSQEISPKK